MFVFVTDPVVWTRELMCHIMGCGHFFDQKDILKFIYCLIIIFFTVYIFKQFITVSTM
jgi:hypothetical protein